MELIFTITSIAIFSAAIIFLVFLLRKRKKGRLLESLGMTLFLVRMPKYEKIPEGKDIKTFIAKMEQIYSMFLYLKKRRFIKGFLYGSQRVALEIASELGRNDISFYIAVPTSLEEEFVKAVQGVYPGARLDKVPEDYTVFVPNGKVAASFLKLQKSVYFPLKTYKALEADPISSITNALSNITPEEGAAIQIVLQPTDFKIKENGSKIIFKMTQEGKLMKTALAEVERSKILELSDEFRKALSPEEKSKKERELPSTTSNEEAIIEAIKVKMKQPVMSADIRLVGVASTQARAESILSNLEHSFSQFYSNYNSLQPVRVKGSRRLKKFIYNFSFREFTPAGSSLLNLEELTSIYHFPLSNIESPNIRWVKTKEAVPPTELPASGEVLIGEAVFREEKKPVWFASAEDRRRHFYIVGQTGTGKTSLLREMIRQDIQKGRGVGVIDPHGDLVEATLANIPKERADDVVLFEPFDTERPCGLNMLEWNTPEQKDFAVSEMITIFSKLFPPEIIGPMFEHYMRNAMLALMADKEKPGTLVEIPRIFTDKEFMEKKLEKVTDPLVKSFWQKEWAQTTGSTRSDMLGYVVSKVGRFVENAMMRNIIGQPHSSFDLEKIMQEGKIFLANLSKGLTGEVNSSLLGLILVSKMQIAAMKRANIPEEERRDFYLYIDEFQNFTTNTIATILSEARKYRLNLILAHQFMPQLTDEIKNAVIGNAGTIASFRVGAIDAEFLEKQFEPEFSKFDLLNLDNFQFITKMMLKNNLTSPFKVETIPPKPGNPSIVEPIKRLSKLKYAKSKETVEKEILENLHF